MADHEEAAQGSDFRDCKTGLVVFGILEVVLGAMCALVALLVIFNMIISAGPNKSGSLSLLRNEIQ